MNIRGFLKWQFGGWYKDLTLWGGVVSAVGFLAMYLGCPDPVPYFIIGTGWAMIVFDLARSWFRFSYSVYQLQQNELIRKLKEKEL